MHNWEYTHGLHFYTELVCGLLFTRSRKRWSHESSAPSTRHPQRSPVQFSTNVIMYAQSRTPLQEETHNSGPRLGPANSGRPAFARYFEEPIQLPKAAGGIEQWQLAGEQLYTHLSRYRLLLLALCLGTLEGPPPRQPSTSFMWQTTHVSL